MSGLHEQVLDSLQSNWTSANTDSVTPTFYYARDHKQFKLSEDRVVSYDRSGTREKPSGLGYAAVNLDDSFGLDIYSHTSQALVDLFQTEVLRIMRTIRKSSLSQDLIVVENRGIPASVPGFSIYRWVLECYGKKFGQSL